MATAILVLLIVLTLQFKVKVCYAGS